MELRRARWDADGPGCDLAAMLGTRALRLDVCLRGGSRSRYQSSSCCIHSASSHHSYIWPLLSLLCAAVFRSLLFASHHHQIFN
jgi:hypothetical protein